MTTRFVPINVARIPLLGEFMTWHVQFLVRKPVSGSPLSSVVPCFRKGAQGGGEESR